jgi:hypothetical protein
MATKQASSTQQLAVKESQVRFSHCSVCWSVIS